jgi:hypothetical protein
VIGFSTFSVLAVAPAQAVVMDFESLASPFYSYLGSSYTESGFTITSSLDPFAFAYQIWGSDSPYSTGSTAVTNGQIASTTLTQVGGGAFTLASIDLADYANANPSYYYGGGGGAIPIPVTVDFIGYLVGGGTVSESFTTDALLGMQNFNFTNFTNLTSVEFGSTGSFPYFQFDNINVTSANSTAVPEPFTVLGTLVGAGASVALKRKLARRDPQDIE